MKRLVRPEIFRNKRTTLRAIPLFPFQPVGTEIPVPFVQFSFGRRLAPGFFFRLFQCLPVSVDHGLSQFFFSFLIVSFKMASVQNSCELCQGSNFLKRNSNKLPLFPLLARKPFHLTRKVSGISNRKFSLNGKRLGHHLEAWGYKLQWFLKLSTLAPKPGPRFIV